MRRSTVSEGLKAIGGWKYADADDYHPKANVDKMKAGVPLTDSDRMPWLDRLNKLLRRLVDSWQVDRLAVGCVGWPGVPHCNELIMAIWR